MGGPSGEWTPCDKRWARRGWRVLISDVGESCNCRWGSKWLDGQWWCYLICPVPFGWASHWPVPSGAHGWRNASPPMRPFLASLSTLTCSLFLLSRQDFFTHATVFNNQQDIWHIEAAQQLYSELLLSGYLKPPPFCPNKYLLNEVKFYCVTVWLISLIV